MMCFSLPPQNEGVLSFDLIGGFEFNQTQERFVAGMRFHFFAIGTDYSNLKSIAALKAIYCFGSQPACGVQVGSFQEFWQ